MHSFSTSGDTCGDYITLGKSVGDWLHFWAGMKIRSSGMVWCKVFAQVPVSTVGVSIPGKRCFLRAVSWKGRRGQGCLG